MVQFDVQLARFNFIESENLMLRPFVSADNAIYLAFNKMKQPSVFFYPPFNHKKPVNISW